MENEKKFDLIISVINRGHSDLVVEASREAGANGGTIIYGRGTSVHERESIMGVSILPEKEVIMTLTPSENKEKIMESICNSADLDSIGMGICFSLPVSKVRGISARKTAPIKEEGKTEATASTQTSASTETPVAPVEVETAGEKKKETKKKESKKADETKVEEVAKTIKEEAPKPAKEEKAEPTEKKTRKPKTQK